MSGFWRESLSCGHWAQRWHSGHLWCRRVTQGTGPAGWYCWIDGCWFYVSEVSILWFLQRLQDLDFSNCLLCFHIFSSLFFFFFLSYWFFTPVIWYRLAAPNSKTYIGSGKAAEIKSAIDGFGAETVIFDDELSAGLVATDWMPLFTSVLFSLYISGFFDKQNMHQVELNSSELPTLDLPADQTMRFEICDHSKVTSSWSNWMFLYLAGFEFGQRVAAYESLELYLLWFDFINCFNSYCHDQRYFLFSSFIAYFKNAYASWKISPHSAPNFCCLMVFMHVFSLCSCLDFSNRKEFLEC